MQHIRAKPLHCLSPRVTQTPRARTSLSRRLSKWLPFSPTSGPLPQPPGAFAKGVLERRKGTRESGCKTLFSKRPPLFFNVPDVWHLYTGDYPRFLISSSPSRFSFGSKHCAWELQPAYFLTHPPA